MLINDLSHLEIMSQTPDIFGGSQPFDGLLLSIKDTNLVLQLGSNPLFQTTLPTAPTSVTLSVSGVPSVAISSSTQNINGIVESLHKIELGGFPINDRFTFFTGSSPLLPGV